jgi:hypothetical protein
MKKCYTKMKVINGKTNVVMKNHSFVREKGKVLNTCVFCGIIVNNELIRLGNEQTHGRFTKKATQ